MTIAQPSDLPDNGLVVDLDLEQHKRHHTPGQWDHCRYCKNERAEAAAELDAQHDREVDYWIGALADAIDRAGKEVHHAQDGISRLTKTLYDIELVEGTAGDDIEAELETAARALRHVARIVQYRKALFDQ